MFQRVLTCLIGSAIRQLLFLHSVSPFSFLQNEVGKNGRLLAAEGTSSGRSSTGISPRPMLMGAARNALRAFNARVSLTCLYVIARRLPRLLCGSVWIARSQEGGHGALAVWLGTEQNVSVCLMLHRWPSIGLSLSKSMELHCRTVGARKGRETCPAGFRPAAP